MFMDVLPTNKCTNITWTSPQTDIFQVFSLGTRVCNSHLSIQVHFIPRANVWTLSLMYVISPLGIMPALYKYSGCVQNTWIFTDTWIKWVQIFVSNDWCVDQTDNSFDITDTSTFVTVAALTRWWLQYDLGHVWMTQMLSYAQHVDVGLQHRQQLLPDHLQW